MNTMKKLFALVLALAMLMSVSAFAYNDTDAVDDKCEIAVNKLSAMGLFKGDTNNNFKPEGTLTRAEAATLIYRIRNNGSDAGAEKWASTHPFTDVNNWNGGWAAGYIGYCYNYNIIIGRTATTFDPGAPVKGTEFAKMILVAIGYKAEAEGFNDSAKWASKVVMAGDEAGLFNEYGIALGGAASRQWVAKMLDNALAAKIPQYIGDYRIPSLSSASDTVAEHFLGFTSETAVIVANDAFALEGSKAGEKKTMVKVGDAISEIDYESKLDMVGQQVMIAKDSEGKIINVVATGKTVKGDLTIDKTEKTENKVTKTLYTAKIAGKVIKDVKEVEAKDIDVLAINFDGKAVVESKTFDVAVIYNAMKNRGADMKATAYDYEGDGEIDAYVVSTAVYGKTVTEIKADTKKDADIEIQVGSEKLTVKREQVVAAKLAAGSVVKVEVINTKAVVTVVAATKGTMIKADPRDDSTIIGGITYMPAVSDGMGYYVINPDLVHDDVLPVLGYDVVVYVTGGNKMITLPVKETALPADPGTETPTAIDLSKIAYVIDVKEVTTIVSDGEWGGTKEVKVLKVQMLLANGATVIYTYDDASKVKDIVACDKAALEALKDKVVEFVYANGKVVIKKSMTEVKDVAFGVGKMAYSFERKTFNGTTLAKDSTVVFVKYTKDSKVVYSVMKMSQFESKVDGVEFDVIAKTTAAISDALIVVKDFGAENLPGTAPEAPKADTVTVLVTRGVVPENEGKDKDGNPINIGVFQGYDLANLSKGVQDFKCVNPKAEVEEGAVYTVTLTNGKVAADKDMVKASIEDGIGSALAKDKWVNDSVKAVAGEVILVGDVLVSAKLDLAEGCIVLKKNANGTMAAAKFADIIKAKEGAKNIVINTNEKGKIAMIIFTADGTAY